MKIGSSADWHLDAGLDADIEKSVRQMIKIFRDGKVDLIALPGDLFDRKSTPEGRNLLRALIQELAEIAHVLICYGNHDEPGDLDIFGEVKSRWPIMVHSKPYVLHVGQILPNRFRIHVLPWFTKSTWKAAHPETAKEQGDIAVSRLAMEYLKQSIDLARKKDDGAKDILLSHLVIDGARLENHQPFKGEGIKFGRYDLVEAGFHGGIFGHIHLRQTFDEAGPMFFYNGSPAALDFGEHPDKYCSIMDVHAETVEWHKLDTVDRYSMEYLWRNGGLVEQGTYEPARIRGSRVRMLLKIDEGEDTARAKEVSEKLLLELGALEVKIEPQIQPKEAIRAGEISIAETMEEKLEAYWKANDNYPTQADQIGMKDKLRQLEEKL